MRGLLMLLALLALPLTSLAKNILIIGDSHSCATYGFGPTLFSALAKNNSVTMYCAESSTASNWIKGGPIAGHTCWIYDRVGKRTPCQRNGAIPPLNSILAAKKYKYDEAVIALGTNSEWQKKPPASYAALAALLAKGHVRCNWVSPPMLRPDQVPAKLHTKHDIKKYREAKVRIAAMSANTNDFYKNLKASVGQTCPVIDSRKLTAPGSPGGNTSDAIHRSAKAGAAWANGIVAQLFHQPLTRAPEDLTAGANDGVGATNIQ